VRPAELLTEERVLLEHVAEELPRLRVVRSEGQRVAQLLESLGVLPVPDQQSGGCLAGLHEIRFAAECLIKGFQCPHTVPLFIEAAADAEMSEGKIGFSLNGLVKMHQGARPVGLQQLDDPRP
jgi:hypothetical protein